MSSDERPVDRLDRCGRRRGRPRAASGRRPRCSAGPAERIAVVALGGRSRPGPAGPHSPSAQVDGRQQLHGVSAQVAGPTAASPEASPQRATKLASMRQARRPRTSRGGTGSPRRCPARRRRPPARRSRTWPPSRGRRPGRRSGRSRPRASGQPGQQTGGRPDPGRRLGGSTASGGASPRPADGGRSRRRPRGPPPPGSPRTPRRGAGSRRRCRGTGTPRSMAERAAVSSPLAAQRSGTGPEGPHPGQHHPGRAGTSSGSSTSRAGAPRCYERLLGRPQVADAVVEDGDGPAPSLTALPWSRGCRPPRPARRRAGRGRPP